jgi:hypothetical protein
MYFVNRVNSRCQLGNKESAESWTSRGSNNQHSVFLPGDLIKFQQLTRVFNVITRTHHVMAKF